jgi:hypothetical protein
MRLTILLSLILAGCVGPLGKPPSAPTDVFLEADTDPNATHCGGFINDVRIQDYPVYTESPRCRFLANNYLKNGNNTWLACNSAPGRGESCVSTPLNFKTKGGPQ